MSHCFDLRLNIKGKLLMSLRIYGNRLLKTLPGQQTRPTPARVREAVFNIWQGSLSGCRWLDLCAGAGSMSAEALCRGADQVVAIEQWGRACGIIRENLQKVATDEQSFTILRGDVVKQLKTLQGQQFDRIYFDPPYASDLYQPVIEAIAQIAPQPDAESLLAPLGELAVEHDRDRSLNSIVSDEHKAPFPLEICRQKVYGNTAVTFYRRIQD